MGLGEHLTLSCAHETKNYIQVSNFKGILQFYNE